MKNLRLMMVILLSAVIGFAVTSCKDESPTDPGVVEPPPLTELEIAADFSFRTLQNVNLQIDMQAPDGTPLQGLRIEVSDRAFSETGKTGLISDGISGQDGRFNASLNFSTEIEHLYVRTDLVGAKNQVELPIAGENLQHSFRVSSQRNLIPPGKRNGDHQIDLVHFEDPKNTGANMSIVIYDITGIEIVEGAELACITPDGLIAGVEVADAGLPCGMAVWGDDNTTEEIDGFRTGEELAFLYWDPPRKEEIVAEATAIDGGLTYTSNGFSVVNLLVEPKGRFRYLGNWDSDGVPDYLDNSSDQIDNALIQRLSSNFPEAVNLQDTHPDFILQHANIHVSDNADVWISFIHNGSLIHNPFGFYSYSGDEIPQNPQDLGELKIIFPNPAIGENGAGLHTGDRVHLGRFEANTTIGWFILANGWQNNAIADGEGLLYSNSNLNPENSGNLKQHCMLFLDRDSDQLILGFEDKRRDQQIDHDFNDVMVAITASPANAIDMQGIPTLEPDARLADSDNDGVPDVIDHWPINVNSSFGTFFPSWSQNFTLAFEDDWPDVGDYDFNDLVVNGHFTQVTNSQGMVTSIEAMFDIQAAGSNRHNGFGFSLPIPPENIQAVTGLNISGNYITLLGNNVEAGQESAVIIVFDDVLNLASPADGFNLINTEPGSPKVSADPLNINISFVNPVSVSVLGSSPYNPFIILDRQRGNEIHLADLPATTLADLNLFGTGEDESSPESGRFYKSHYNLPWALIVPETWQHTNESTGINLAYPDFGPWAESSGGASRGWFNTNINPDHIWTGR